MVDVLNQELTNQLSELFETQLTHPVELIYFFRKDACATCDETGELLDELASLTDKLHVTKYDWDENQDIAQEYNVQLTPGLVVAGGGSGEPIDYGIRFAGVPSGYEFGSLIHTVIMVSKRDSGLKPGIREQLKGLQKPVHLQVFVTPTWPHCPQAVVLAHQLAMESPFIEAESIEAIEFYDLAMRYNVSGVPQTTINDGAGLILGAVPEEYLLQELNRAI